MKLLFTENDHKYITDTGIQFRSITGIVHSLCQPFDWTPEQSSKSRKAGNKWKGMDPVEIQAAWDSENERSRDLGHWYHLKKEQELLTKPNVHSCIYEGDVKIAPEQKLKDGIYPEHFCYLESAKVCGQSDIVIVEDQKWLDIEDHKTCKEIKTESYKNYEGIHKKMLAPVNHLMDCHISHYSLQLSLYAYIILRHNPHLQVRNMVIHHVLFEEEGRDKYDYPLYKKDNEGNYIVRDIIDIPIRYMKNEAHSIITKIKEGRL